jgi:hypothetical protein
MEPAGAEELEGYLRARIANLELDLSMARDELQRNKKARINWQNETNAVMGSIRSAFGVPEDVPLTSFAAWLNAELQRRENAARAQFQRRLSYVQNHQTAVGRDAVGDDHQGPRDRALEAPGGRLPGGDPQ